MDNYFIAHRRESDGAIQPVGNHLLAVGVISGRNASKLKIKDPPPGIAADLEAIGRLLGLLHDLGKYSREFQHYLQSATKYIDQDNENYVDADLLKGQIDHSSAGAQYIWNHFRKSDPRSQMIAQILALCIASHHSGLIDCISPQGEDRFTRRMTKAEERAHLAEAGRNIDEEVLSEVKNTIEFGRAIDTLLAFITQIVNTEREIGGTASVLEFKIGLLTRILLSCVIDADRVDTADFDTPRNRRLRQGQQPTDWAPLTEKLEAFTAKLPSTKPIDTIRRIISDHCLVAASKPKGIYTLTVPTGGGKTLASLRYALHHAQLNNLDRVIFVVPFTSIIDQNADVAREVLEPKGSGIEPGSVVLEHHSNLTPEEQTWRAKILSENWDAPVVFTTTVQFLESLFGGGTRGARRMHQLANAVIIFDEAQAIPVKCVHLFNNAINFLTEHCGSTVVLCTATQPLLNGVSVKNGCARFSEADEIMPNVSELFESLKRVDVIPLIRAGGWSDTDVIKLANQAIAESGSCLIIVNTRNAAMKLFVEADMPDGKYHLSTSMCPMHRRKQLAEIRKRLLKGLPTLCISTQLIEAGVDVDFGTVIRHIAGLDSIAQAAGRCNRNGLRHTGKVYVINPSESKINRLVDIKIGSEISERIVREYQSTPDTFGKSLIGPQAITEYFRYYFYAREEKDEMSYQIPDDGAGRSNTIRALLSENGMAVNAYKQKFGNAPQIYLKQSFMAAGKAFRAIDSPTRGVIVPYEEGGAALINELCSSFKPELQYKLIRRAQQYSVNVFPHVFEELQKMSAIMEIGEGTGIYHLLPTYYDNQFGLTLTPTNPLEDLYA